MRSSAYSPTTKRSARALTRLRGMATIRIPPVLRPAVGGEKELSAEGDSVGAILRSVVAAHPDTQTQLFSGDGALNRYVNVYLNDEDVRVLDGLETAVSESDTLVILPAMAGGR
jgi:sulfur-carrier protein